LPAVAGEGLGRSGFPNGPGGGPILMQINGKARAAEAEQSRPAPAISWASPPTGSDKSISATAILFSSCGRSSDAGHTAVLIIRRISTARNRRSLAARSGHPGGSWAPTPWTPTPPPTWPSLGQGQPPEHALLDSDPGRWRYAATSEWPFRAWIWPSDRCCWGTATVGPRCWPKRKVRQPLQLRHADQPARVPLPACCRATDSVGGALRPGSWAVTDQEIQWPMAPRICSCDK